MIKLKDLLVEANKTPSHVQKIEDKIGDYKYYWYNKQRGSNRYRDMVVSRGMDKLRTRWERAMEKEYKKSGWTPDYNFGDLLA